MRVVFDHSENEAEHVLTFYFRPKTRLNYTAGQYIELTLHHSPVDSYGDKRLFTLSSSPTDAMVSITSKFTSNDGSSFKWALRHLKPGDILEMSEPMGDFVLPKLTQAPLVFVAGGIGITPFHSILSWMAATGERRPVKLLYGVNTDKEIVFQPALEKATQELTIVINNPPPAWTGQKGYITADLILGLEQPAPDALIYVSGPEAMVQGLQQDLLKAGIKDHQLVLDAFLGYPHTY